MGLTDLYHVLLIYFYHVYNIYIIYIYTDKTRPERPRGKRLTCLRERKRDVVFCRVEGPDARRQVKYKV